MDAPKSKKTQRLLSNHSTNDLTKATLIGSKNGLDKEGHVSIISGKPFILKRLKMKFNKH